MKKIILLNLIIGASAFVSPAQYVSPGMVPTLNEEYYYDDGWVLIGAMNMEYDKEGRVIRNVINDGGEIMTIRTEYNDNGMRSAVYESYGEGDDERVVTKRTYLYDPIVPSFCIERMGYDFTGSEWQPNYYCEENIITRNDAGNIVSIVKRLPMLSMELSDAYRTIWTYDEATGKANGFAYYLNTDGTDAGWRLNQDTDYRNIEWYATDGQMTGDIMEMLEGANRISSATAFYKGELDGYIFVVYPREGYPDYIVRETTADPQQTGTERILETLDANGSLRYQVNEYFDFDEDDNIVFFESPVITMTETYLVDEKGNPLSDIFTETNYGTEEQTAGERYRNTYDEAGNLVEVITETYDYDSQEYFLTTRLVLSGYIDPSSSVNPIADNSPKRLRISDGQVSADGIIRAYSAEGILLTEGKDALDLRSLPSGIIILRSESEVQKVVIR